MANWYKRITGLILGKSSSFNQEGEIGYSSGVIEYRNASGVRVIMNLEDAQTVSGTKTHSAVQIFQAALRLAVLTDANRDLYSPTGTKGDIIYNDTDSEVQFSDGTSWEKLIKNSINSMRVLGRTSSGAGTIEELPINNFIAQRVTISSGAGLISNSDISASSFIFPGRASGLTGTLSYTPTTGQLSISSDNGSDSGTIDVFVIP